MCLDNEAHDRKAVGTDALLNVRRDAPVLGASQLSLVTVPPIIDDEDIELVFEGISQRAEQRLVAAVDDE